MAEKILIMGESGRGKSRSIKNLPPEETVLIRVLKKPLPFIGWKKGYKIFNKDTKEGNVFDIYTAPNIIKCMDYVNLEMPQIKYIIVDDAGAVMSLELFDKVKVTGFEKFTEVALNMKNVLAKPDLLRDDLYVAFMFHVEESSFNGFNKLKAKTAGKMLDTTLGVESMFTYVLMVDIMVKGKDEKDHVFITSSDGTNTVKMPEGMFDSKYIPNDLKFVIDSIEKYNNG